MQETLFDIMAEAQNDLLRNVGGLDKIADMVERQVHPAQPDEATSVASELRDLAQSSRATAREDLEEISKLRPAPVSAENAIAPEAAEEMAVETAVVAPKKPRTPRKTATTKKGKLAKAPDPDPVTKPTRTRRAAPRVSP